MGGLAGGKGSAMKRIFAPVVMSWEGVEYTIPAANMLHCIAEVENVLTLGELANARERARLPLAKLAIAYGIALRYAGATVSDEEVYAGMFKDAGAELQQRSFGAIVTLQALMVPPAHLRAEPGKGNGAGEAMAASSPDITKSS